MYRLKPTWYDDFANINHIFKVFCFKGIFMESKSYEMSNRIEDRFMFFRETKDGPEGSVSIKRYINNKINVRQRASINAFMPSMCDLYCKYRPLVAN